MISTLTINDVVTVGNGNDQIQLGQGNNTVTAGNDTSSSGPATVP